jgi:hypothetical protein
MITKNTIIFYGGSSAILVYFNCSLLVESSRNKSDPAVIINGHVPGGSGQLLVME